MSQKLPVNDFKWIKKKELFNLHKDLPFLPECKKVNNVEKLICDVGDKKNMLFI